jgi:uncharacterized LabA/DUF88 family protein
MNKTAILVDGGFYRRRAKHLWGIHSPRETADALYTYCLRHLVEHKRSHDLYRIFFYDCPPSDKQLYHPLTGRSVNLRNTDEYRWVTAFHDELKSKRKVALRMGSLDDSNSVYNLNYAAVKKLCAGKMKLEDLTERDFEITIKQKGVDMKLGIDIASLAYKQLVNQIVLIAGDSDFVPAAKLARREGLDVVLDPLEMPLSRDNQLFEHIDGLRSCGNPYR